MRSCSREEALLWTQKRKLSKCRGFGVYPMDKTGSRRKMFKTRANAASSQSLLKLLLWGEIAL
jgi:hypothetical protein